MTQEDQATADAVAAKAKADADAQAKANPKSYSEEEFKKVIAERQEAKEKLRAYEETAKKAQDEKAKAEGKTAELLLEREKEVAALKAEKETLSAEAAKFREKQEALKQQLLNKITDVDLKRIAEKLDVDDLTTYVEKVNGQKFDGSGKHQLGTPSGEYFSRDEVNRMSQVEVDRNIDKINKSMETWTN